MVTQKNQTFGATPVKNWRIETYLDDVGSGKGRAPMACKLDAAPYANLGAGEEVLLSGRNILSVSDLENMRDSDWDTSNHETQEEHCENKHAVQKLYHLAEVCFATVTEAQKDREQPLACARTLDSSC
eukprot:ANDGO_04727.mRNA.1 hypothetical protein